MNRDAVTAVNNLDHVRVRHPARVFCELCGQFYDWNTPVPIDVFLGGNKAFMSRHADCADYRQQYRAGFLGWLLAKRGAR